MDAHNILDMCKIGDNKYARYRNKHRIALNLKAAQRMRMKREKQRSKQQANAIGQDK